LMSARFRVWDRSNSPEAGSWDYLGSRDTAVGECISPESLDAHSPSPSHHRTTRPSGAGARTTLGSWGRATQTIAATGTTVIARRPSLALLVIVSPPSPRSPSNRNAEAACRRPRAWEDGCLGQRQRFTHVRSPGKGQTAAETVALLDVKLVCPKTRGPQLP